MTTEIANAAYNSGGLRRSWYRSRNFEQPGFREDSERTFQPVYARLFGLGIERCISIEVRRTLG